MLEAIILRLKNGGRCYQTYNQIKNTSLEKIVVKEKLQKYLGWYEEFSGLAEVRKVQDKVVDTQNKFGQIQEERRELSKKLMECQDRLKVIHSEIEKTSRGERRFITLVEEECNVMGEESQYKKKCEILDREEKDIFNLLTNYVNESHEKERNYANRTKYWSLIGSVFGTLLGLLGSSINDRLKMREHRQHVNNLAKRMDNSVLSIENALKAMQSTISSVSLKSDKSTSANMDQIFQSKNNEDIYYSTRLKTFYNKLKSEIFGSNDYENYAKATGLVIVTTAIAVMLLKS